MKHLLLLLLTLALNSSMLLAQEESYSIDLDSIITVINRSLDLAKERIKKDSIELNLTGAKINLKTLYSKEKSGGFKLFVKGDVNIQNAQSHSVTYNYSFPTKSKVFHENEYQIFMDFNLSQGLDSLNDLSNAIVDAAKQWHNTTVKIGDLEQANYTVEIVFAIKKEESGGISFDLFGIEFGGGTKKSDSIFHSVELSFR